jgi:mono/diheme cytochrome c family protein
MAMRIPFPSRLELLAVLLFAPLATPVIAADTNGGKEMYLKYCSSCHGPRGKGDGPVSRDLKTKVPDLTLLRSKNKGLYPLDQVMSSIDGRRTVRGHGDRKMPVWGEVFTQEHEKGKYTELTSLLKAKVIAEYIETLQK